MRIKGVRPIHWQNKRTSSYKIDLIGNNRLWGMEEFSVQKPITKNYAYEFLFHKFLKRTNNLYLKYFPLIFILMMRIEVFMLLRKAFPKNY